MRILIVNPFGIGDVLFSLPLVRALREAETNFFLGYLCNRRTEELVAAWPELDWRLTFEKDEFRAALRDSKIKGVRFLNRTLRAVRKERFDLLIDLSLGWHTGLAGILCRIPRRIGFNFRGRGKFLTCAVPLNGFSGRPVAEYYLDLLEPLEIPRPPAVSAEIQLPERIEEETRHYLESHGVNPSSRMAGIVPGGGASWGPNAVYKQWPAERFALAADHLARQGLQILLIGDARELPLCRAVADRMSHPPRLIAQTPSLLLLAGLLRKFKIVVGNDGGTMHLAAAVGTPTVSIFGPVDATVYGPHPGGPSHRVVSKTLVCRPCYRSFRFPPCPWENACLKDLEVAPVTEAADDLLKQGASR